MKKYLLFFFLLASIAACKDQSWTPGILVEVNAGQDSRFLKVENHEDFSCKNIKIQVNNQYGGMLPELKAHEEKLAALSQFKDEQGHAFSPDVKVQQILVHAEKEDGTSGEISYGQTEE